MQLKIKLAALLAASCLMASQNAENEFGVYVLPTPQSTYVSNDAREAMCKTFGDGYKVPNIQELFNAPSTIREKAEKSLYASSTKNPQNKSEIYYHSFENRDVNIVNEKESLYLVCFKETKKEQEKNLNWGKTERSRMDFKEAKSFCEAKGARLPSANELFSIAVMKISNEQEYKTKYGFTQPKYYWSSDVNDDFSNTAIVVGFLRASVASSAKENKSFVRCVSDAK